MMAPACSAEGAVSGTTAAVTRMQTAARAGNPCVPVRDLIGIPESATPTEVWHL
jgi:hypothetical protein